MMANPVVCPKCGNADPAKLFIETAPVRHMHRIRKALRIPLRRFIGWRCGRCSHVIEDAEGARQAHKEAMQDVRNKLNMVVVSAEEWLDSLDRQQEVIHGEQAEAETQTET